MTAAVTAHRGRRLARIGLAAALVSRLFGRLVGIVLVVVLARRADADSVAVYGYLLGTASLVIALTSVGVASIGAREVAAGRMPVEGALHAALLPQTLSLVVAGALTVALTVIVGPDAVPPGALALTLAFVLVSGFNGLYAELLRGHGRVLLEGGLQMAGAVALVAGGVAVVRHGGGATELLLVVLAKEAAMLLVGMVLIRPRRRPGVGARQLLGQSLWLAVAGTLLIVLWRQGMVVTGAVGGVGGLAAYVVASRFLDAGVTVAHTASVGLRPGLSALAADPAAMRAAVRHYLGLTAGIGVGVAVVGGLAAAPLVSLAFGPRWADAVAPVRVIALSAPPILLTFVALSALVARRQVRLVTAGAGAGAACGLLVSLVLPHWQPAALSAVIGTGMGAAVVAAVFLVGLRDLLGAHRPTFAPFPAGGPIT